MKKVILFICLIAFATNIQAQLNPEFVKIPMRDGDSLAATIFRPNQVDQFPTILIQTPYNKFAFQLLGLPLGVGYNISSSNYAYVVVDWRCFWGSVSACGGSSSRGEDGYDVVEWIADQSWSDGKVGTWGPSALGNVQFDTAREQPPSLVCAVPIVASPHFSYQQYLPGGAARVEYIETLSQLFGVLGGFNAIAANPYYNITWVIAESVTMYPDEIEVPMFLIAGWLDHNASDDFILIDTLRNASGTLVKNKHKILIGPWKHGGTGGGSVGTVQQGELSFPEAAKVNDTLALEFFDFYLRDINNSWEQRDRYIFFQMGDNIWQSTNDWPPANLANQTFYLHGNGSLQSSIPTSPIASLSYNYDPEDPSPTIGGKTLSDELLQGPYDQSPEVESRSDVLVFSTETLTQDVRLKGKVKVRLYVASDKQDTDFTLRLTEVYPDGRSILLGESIQRMRFRNGYTLSDEIFMVPTEVYPIDLEFDPLGNTFKSGNKIRLIVSSSNYPRFNRNMNTGGEMYPDNNLDSLENPQIALNTVHLSSTYPSFIELPLEGFATATINPDLHINDLKIYPNPTDGELFISGISPDQLVQIFDQSGKIVISFNNITEGKSLDVSGLASGIYTVRLVDKAGNVRIGSFKMR